MRGTIRSWTALVKFNLPSGQWCLYERIEKGSLVIGELKTVRLRCESITMRALSIASARLLEGTALAESSFGWREHYAKANESIARLEGFWSWPPTRAAHEAGRRKRGQQEEVP